MNGAAAEVDGVVGQLTLNEGVAPFHTHVVQLEERQDKGQNGGAHLHGGMARLGINTARVGYADGQIHVPHDLGKDDGRDVG